MNNYLNLLLKNTYDMKLVKLFSTSTLCLFIFCGSENIFSQTNFWEQTSGPMGTAIKALTVNSDGYLFAATGDSGVYRSSDAGQHWRQINNGLIDINTLSIISKKNNLVIVGTYSTRMFRSIDNGDTWSRIDSGMLSRTFSIYSLALDKQGNLYAGSYYPSIFKGGSSIVYRSTDDGISWSSSAFGAASCYVYSFAVNDSGHVFAGVMTGCGVYRSIDNGTTWTQLLSEYITSLAIDSNDNIYAGAANGGVYLSTNDGNNWMPIDSGLANIHIHCLAAAQSNKIFAGTAGGGVFFTQNFGKNWIPINSGLSDLRICSFAVDTAAYLYAGTDSGGIFRSSQPVTSVNEIRTKIPTSYSLLQNFPNPFNPSTTIEYEIIHKEYVTISIHDVIGREITKVVDQTQEPGVYRIRFTGASLPSGVYYCTLKAGSFSETMRMMLVK